MDDPTFEIYKKILAETSEEEKFYSYVNAEIDKMKHYLNLNAEGLTFDALNKAIANYASIYFTLQSLEFFSESKVKNLSKKMSDFYDDKQNDVRKKHNRDDVSGSKWLGQKELESLARQENRELYDMFYNELDIAEKEYRFIQRMVKAWESHSYCLTNLSNNLKAEASITVRNL